MSKRTLLDTVSDRTEQSLGKTLVEEYKSTGAQGYRVWSKEWFRQADLFLEELKTEGLQETYTSLKESIDSLRSLEPR